MCVNNCLSVTNRSVISKNKHILFWEKQQHRNNLCEKRLRMTIALSFQKTNEIYLGKNNNTEQICVNKCVSMTNRSFISKNKHKISYRSFL